MKTNFKNLFLSIYIIPLLISFASLIALASIMFSHRIPDVEKNKASNPPITQKIILIVLDGLVYEAAFDKSYMPNIASLAEQGASGLSTSTWLTMTTPAVRAIGTGMPSDLLDLFQNFGAKETINPNIFQNLKDAGYKTVLAGERIWQKMFTPWIDSSFTKTGLNRFFYYMKAVYEPDKIFYKEVTKNILPALEQPYFFVIHFVGTDHAGHRFNPMTKRYQGKTLDIDKKVAHIVNMAGNDATIIITSDHGMTHNGKHGGGQPETRRTPIIFYGKGIKSRANLSIDQVDLAPTISMLAGIPIPEYSTGRALTEIADADNMVLKEITKNNINQLSKYAVASGAKVVFENEQNFDSGKIFENLKAALNAHSVRDIFSSALWAITLLCSALFTGIVLLSKKECSFSLIEFAGTIVVFLCGLMIPFFINLQILLSIIAFVPIFLIVSRMLYNLRAEIFSLNKIPYIAGALLFFGLILFLRSKQFRADTIFGDILNEIPWLISFGAAFSLSFFISKFINKKNHIFYGAPLILLSIFIAAAFGGKSFGLASFGIISGLLLSNRENFICSKKNLIFSVSALFLLGFISVYSGKSGSTLINFSISWNSVYLPVRIAGAAFFIFSALMILAGTKEKNLKNYSLIAAGSAVSIFAAAVSAFKLSNQINVSLLISTLFLAVSLIFSGRYKIYFTTVSFLSIFTVLGTPKESFVAALIAVLFINSEKLPIFKQEKNKFYLLAAAVFVYFLRGGFVSLIEGNYSFSAVETYVALLGNREQFMPECVLKVAAKTFIPLALLFFISSVNFSRKDFYNLIFLVQGLFLLRIFHIISAIVITGNQYYMPAMLMEEMVFYISFIICSVLFGLFSLLTKFRNT